jgi:hypothetical protein
MILLLLESTIRLPTECIIVLHQTDKGPGVTRVCNQPLSPMRRQQNSKWEIAYHHVAP